MKKDIDTSVCHPHIRQMNAVGADELKKAVYAYCCNVEEEDIQKYIEDEIYSEHNMPLYELYTYVSDYQPDMATLNDWKAISNWGVVNRNGKEKLVIIDDGFNENVYHKFYKRF